MSKILIQEEKFGSEDLSNYEKKQKIGDGTFGSVYKALDKKGERLVAMKKIALQKNGEVPTECLREICILRDLNHPNIVPLLDVVPSKQSMYLVFEYCLTDLRTFLQRLDSKVYLDPITIKKLMFGLFCGLAQCHKKRVIHRDLKTANILLNKQGQLKIADFGIARVFTVPSRPLSIQIMTPWYRAPEITLGCKRYSTAIDIWSAGCIFAELITKKVLFEESNSIIHLLAIFRKLGTPDYNVIPELIDFKSKLAGFPSFTRQPVKSWIQHMDLGLHLQDLLSKILVFNPNERITAEDALKHPYFDEVRNASDLRINMAQFLL